MAALAVSGLGAAAFAADHGDSENAAADPTADIADVYTWVDETDSDKLNLVLTTTATAGWSTATQYVFHIERQAAFSDAVGSGTVTDIICQYYTDTELECWAGDQYVEGDASATAGLSSAAGTLKVFAGQRGDPFFMNFSGFSSAATAVQGAVSMSNVPAGTATNALCPDWQATEGDGTNATLNALRGLLSDSAATDNFETANVQAIVVQIDTSVLGGTGDILRVWSATHRAN